MDAMNETTPVESLDALPDESLRDLIDRAKSLLAARQSERRKQALAQIQQLAKAHGLAVAVRQPARKRGRPPKADPQT
ncbi:H-NS histone family protein [Skermanella rosea]|uniref:hypothetical protein n=1 Tax=Skermanella rosea TaxID=1817965 RepID=UPI00193174DF|nr:hypothetical protein [Skermanella rosea]UEM04741.1 H-NS histone family protein [Skermanella rosea]